GRPAGRCCQHPQPPARPTSVCASVVGVVNKQISETMPVTSGKLTNIRYALYTFQLIS
ncbi:unnamed protein product, partial [Callosobruchus maculatus]